MQNTPKVKYFFREPQNFLKNQGYEKLYNGDNVDNWNIIYPKEGMYLPKLVFMISENGEMHVFKDFEYCYGFEEEKNQTYCMFFTKKYSRYSFKFKYKWGSKHINNFDQFQYDAGFISTFTM
ncbi:hypothetical protein [Maribacter sp. 2308TA10-17]|uniref:hypothetical protein n=1 Tax=Maribacter sp. 2308TA10-17 TaxID=3386276 RepID=UPI0039BC2D6A